MATTKKCREINHRGYSCILDGGHEGQHKARTDSGIRCWGSRGPYKPRRGMCDTDANGHYAYHVKTDNCDNWKALPKARVEATRVLRTAAPKPLGSCARSDSGHWGLHRLMRTCETWQEHVPGDAVVMTTDALLANHDADRPLPDDLSSVIDGVDEKGQLAPFEDEQGEIDANAMFGSLYGALGPFPGSCDEAAELAAVVISNDELEAIATSKGFLRWVMGEPTFGVRLDDPEHLHVFRPGELRVTR